MSEEWKRVDPSLPSEDSQKLLSFLKKNVIGQDHAIENIADAADVFKAGIRVKDKPMYSALFLGPTGVGKTLVAEVLAEYLFGSRSAFTKIECEKFSESHRIADLIGAPAGYVGFWNPGDHQHRGVEPILSQRKIDYHGFMQRKDVQDIQKQMRELEKKLHALQMKWGASSLSKQEREALSREMNGLFSHLGFLEDQADQMYDDGSYQSIILFDALSNGMVTKFNNAIILMTSNVGSRDISDLLSKKGLGFKKESEAQLDLDKDIYEYADKAVRKVFAPEFLNRFDKISVFRPHTKNTIRQILEVELKKLSENLLEIFPIILRVDDEVKDFIIEEATDRLEDGARLLNKKITKYVREPISRLKNRKEIKVRDEVRLALDRSGAKPKVIAFIRVSQQKFGHH